MGLCLSHCGHGGQAQHKAAVVAVSISHQSSASPARPSRSDSQADASQSLKRFLHLYSDGSEVRKLSSASPRGSLDDSLAIPHSSELFSLPSEGGSESDRSRSPSPARGSVASIARSSISSRAPVSPKSVGVRPGRFSTDKPPMPPRTSNAKKVPARKSCSSLGQVREPHKNLVETIARLEKFCDVKLFLEKRSSLVRYSSHEMTAACAHENSILLHDSCRNLAQKLLCFANEHAHHNCHGDGVLSRSMRRCDSAKEMKSDAPELKECVPLEKSVASFLKEVENFVCKVDIATPSEGERDEGVSRLPSLRFLDADEKIQFTDFEATFESPRSEPTETNPCDRSLEADQLSTQDTQDQQARPSASAECEAENAAPMALRRPSHRHSRTTSDFGGMYHVDGTTKGSQQEKKPKNLMPRLALTDIDSNIAPVHDPLARESNPLKARTPTGLKRGVTRSLDLQDGCIPQLELDALKRQRWGSTHKTHDSTQGAAATLSREEAQRSSAADSETIERLAREGEGDAASPSADAVAPSESQAIKGRVSVEAEEPTLQESVCTEDANGGIIETPDLQATDTGLLNRDSEKSLSMAFDNLLKLLQSPTAELVQNTSERLELLAQPGGANTELSVDGTHLSEVETAPETQADTLPLYEAENWHDAPTSLITTFYRSSQSSRRRRIRSTRRFIKYNLYTGREVCLLIQRPARWQQGIDHAFDYYSFEDSLSKSVQEMQQGLDNEVAEGI